MTQHEAAMRLERAWVDLRIVVDAVPLTPDERRSIVRTITGLGLLLNEAAQRLRTTLRP